VRAHHNCEARWTPLERTVWRSLLSAPSRCMLVRVRSHHRSTDQGACVVVQKELREDYPAYKKKVARCVARSLEDC